MSAEQRPAPGQPSTWVRTRGENAGQSVADRRTRTDGACDDAEIALRRHASRDLQEVAEAIRALPSGTKLGRAYAVGEIVIERLYGGDASRWRSRGRKAHSIRTLAGLLQEHASASPSSLFRCIATYALLRGGAGPSSWTHVSITHVRTVLPVPRPERQLELLRRAEQERWSVAELRKAIGHSGRGSTKHGWREAVAARLVVELEAKSAELVEELQRGPPRRPAERFSLLEGVMRACESLEAARELTSPKRFT